MTGTDANATDVAKHATDIIDGTMATSAVSAPYAGKKEINMMLFINGEAVNALAATKYGMNTMAGI